MCTENSMVVGAQDEYEKEGTPIEILELVDAAITNPCAKYRQEFRDVCAQPETVVGIGQLYEAYMTGRHGALATVAGGVIAGIVDELVDKIKHEEGL